MRKQMRRISRSEEEADINLTPMLDVVFIMLIFFIVTPRLSSRLALTYFAQRQ